MQPELITRSTDNLRHGRGFFFQNWPGFPLLGSYLRRAGALIIRIKAMSTDKALCKAGMRKANTVYIFCLVWNLGGLVSVANAHLVCTLPWSGSRWIRSWEYWVQGRNTSCMRRLSNPEHHVHAYKHWPIILASPTTSMFLEGGNKLQMYMSTWSSGSNSEPWTCEAVMPPTAPCATYTL